MAHIDPIPAQAEDPRVRQVFDVFTEHGREVPMLYRILGNAPSMLEAWVGLAWPLRSEPTTPRALRELLIMRVAILTDASFEWWAHWPAALAAGVSQEQLEALGSWADSGLFSEAEQAALRCTDEMVESGGASADAVAKLQDHHPEGECVELILTAAFYCCVSHTLHSFGIEADDGGDPTALDVFRRLRA